MDGWTVLIAAHAMAATLALVVGAAQLLRRRFGDRPHRVLGRLWVVLSAWVALSSFTIQRLHPGSFSWIHILSVVTLVSLVTGTAAARRHDRVPHAVTMASAFAGQIGALIGVVAVPSRLLPRAFQADWLGMTVLTLGAVGLALALVAAVSLWLGSRPLGRRRRAVRRGGPMRTLEGPRDDGQHLVEREKDHRERRSSASA